MPRICVQGDTSYSYGWTHKQRHNEADTRSVKLCKRA